MRLGRSWYVLLALAVAGATATIQGSAIASPDGRMETGARAAVSSPKESVSGRLDARGVETAPTVRTTRAAGIGPETLGIAVVAEPPKWQPQPQLTIERLPVAPKPADPGWVATRLAVPALGIDVALNVAGSDAEEDFPAFSGAFLLRSSSQPGHGGNSFIFAHAMPDLFKPLWWAQTGQEVLVTMSDGQVLAYRITAIHRDVPCPDPSAPKPAGLPPVLAYATECDTSWMLPTEYERLTLQTSQGFNRNYGELIVIAEPAC